MDPAQIRRFLGIPGHGSESLSVAPVGLITEAQAIAQGAHRGGQGVHGFKRERQFIEQPIAIRGHQQSHPRTVVRMRHRFSVCGQMAL